MVEVKAIIFCYQVYVCGFHSDRLWLPIQKHHWSLALYTCTQYIYKHISDVQNIIFYRCQNNFKIC